MPYQFKLSLLDSPVAIWRIFVVPEYYSFDDLHHVIQIVMGWDNSHHYLFKGKGRNRFALVSTQGDIDDEEEYAEDYSLSDLITRIGQKVYYEYDFGDSWIHELTFQKRIEGKAPICIEGTGACPPEDVGGVLGYEIMLKAIKNPRHKEYEEYREWLGMEEGENYNAKYFEIESVNEILKGSFISEE